MDTVQGIVSTKGRALWALRLALTFLFTMIVTSAVVLDASAANSAENTRKVDIGDVEGAGRQCFVLLRSMDEEGRHLAEAIPHSTIAPAVLHDDKGFGGLHHSTSMDAASAHGLFGSAAINSLVVSPHLEEFKRDTRWFFSSALAPPENER